MRKRARSKRSPKINLSYPFSFPPDPLFFSVLRKESLLIAMPPGVRMETTNANFPQPDHDSWCSLSRMERQMRNKFAVIVPGLAVLLMFCAWSPAYAQGKNQKENHGTRDHRTRDHARQSLESAPCFGDTMPGCGGEVRPITEKDSDLNQRVIPPYLLSTQPPPIRDDEPTLLIPDVETLSSLKGYSLEPSPTSKPHRKPKTDSTVPAE